MDQSPSSGMMTAHDDTQENYPDRRARESLLRWLDARQIRREQGLMEDEDSSSEYEEESQDEEESQGEDESQDEDGSQDGGKGKVKDEDESQDEEEVLYELDEDAMAQLPLHLQGHIRQIHIERFCRLSMLNPNLEIRALPHRKGANSRQVTNEHSTHLPHAAHDNVHIGTEIGETFMRSASLRARTPWPRRPKPATPLEGRWMNTQEGYHYGDYTMADMGPRVAPQGYHPHVAPVPENYTFPETDRFEVYGGNAGHIHAYITLPSRKKTPRFTSRVRSSFRKTFHALRRFLKKKS